ncbi:hypothetical protein [uncultured Maribacter sp.]|uniref:hypothetical protein n=1 Tax=uncultured Maribacter sp. TaxID=431308 RepID=UPI002611EF22|nr:hypothetical protein [uncultured Maribacter sp.]
MKYIIYIIISLLALTFSYSQNSNTEMALYNIGSGAIGGSIGAVINKKKGEKTGKVLLKGFLQGALGGYLVYESKNRIGKIVEKGRLEHSWEGKILNSAGVSIIENAASNRDFWDKWHINIGFNRLEFYTKNKFKFKYKITPVSLILTTIVATKNQFDFENTLRTGELIFKNNAINGNNYSGLTYGNVIIFNKNLDDITRTLSHEIIHVYQYYDFNYINSYFDKPRKKWKENISFIEKMNSVFYMDFQAGVLRSLYLIENSNRTNYYDNFFEYEAGFYSKTSDFILK